MQIVNNEQHLLTEQGKLRVPELYIQKSMSDGTFNVCCGTFRRILEIISRFSPVFGFLSNCSEITAYGAGHLTAPDRST